MPTAAQPRLSYPVSCAGRQRSFSSDIIQIAHDSDFATTKLMPPNIDRVDFVSMHHENSIYENTSLKRFTIGRGSSIRPRRRGVRGGRRRRPAAQRILRRRLRHFSGVCTRQRRVCHSVGRRGLRRSDVDTAGRCRICSEAVPKCKKRHGDDRYTAQGHDFRQRARIASESRILVFRFRSVCCIHRT
jgi:hypothetical protein